MSDPRTEHERELTWPWVVALAVVAGLIRLIPHPWNLTPIGALGLFAGARLRSWGAFLVPLAVMAGSDLLLLCLYGDSPFNVYVYGCFLVVVLLGRLLLREGGAARIALVSMSGSLLFFLVTNFGVWLASSVDPAQVPGGGAVAFQTYEKIPYPAPFCYSRNLEGLAACYAAALPFVQTNAPPLGFLGNQLVGDLLYFALLFGLYSGLRRGVFAVRLLPSTPALR